MDNINEILKTLPHQTACGLGWLIDPGVSRQYPWYARIFKEFAPESIFELGTYLGYSLATAALTLPNLKEIYFIDNESYGEVTNSMALDNISFARKLSGFNELYLEATNGKIAPFDGNYDLAHIDGDHHYQPVLDDLNFVFSLNPKVIIGHDYTLEREVEMAVKYFCNENKLVHMVLPEFNHGLWVISTGDYREIESKLIAANVGKVECWGPK